MSCRLIDESQLAELLAKAHQSPRRRSHHNLHSDFSDPVQRVLIGLAEGTCIQPHCHPQPHKWELISALRGRTLVLLFDDSGSVNTRLLLVPAGPAHALQLEPNVWHTLLPMDGSAVVLEVKQGPYDPAERGRFADWAPEEGAAEASQCLGWARHATVGDRFE